jgi:hypothetical protein
MKEGSLNGLRDVAAVATFNQNFDDFLWLVQKYSDGIRDAGSARPSSGKIEQKT